MSAPWLSVIMPTYNGATFLESALASVLAQRERDFEIVAVDDGSTDATLDILRAYRDRLRMTIVEQEHGGNWVRNTNHGMSLASGQYLGWLHQDDLWGPDRLAKLKGLTSRWPDAPLILHPAWFIDAEGNRLGLWRGSLPRRTGRVPSRQVVSRLLIQDFVAASAPIFRAGALADVGRMDEELWSLADWDWWLRLAALGPPVYHPVPLSSFRLHLSSQTCIRIDRADDLVRQYGVLVTRHVDPWEQSAPDGRCVGRAAKFSYRLNVALMQFVARQPVGWLALFGEFLRLGPAGWYVFFRDSQIVKRCLCRMRAGYMKAAADRRPSPLRSRRSLPDDAPGILGEPLVDVRRG